MRNVTPAEKAHRTRVLNFARAVRNLLTASPALATDPAVPVQVFGSLKASREVMADAFWVMDNHPEQFTAGGTHWEPWFGALRACRNHPVHGPELFALWH